ncbi:MAG TPA: lanthionine synthetase LanC family protein [Candidatus Angelobacter sp.]|nr:lanthionine synthetase LanC family protein [Candidatus Angelobacter sp.]
MENNNSNGFASHELADITAKIFSELSDRVLPPASAAAKQPQQFPPLGPDLYDGTSGLAVFFAAYYRATKDPQARRVALESIAPVRGKIDQMVANPGMQHNGPVSIGGLVGLGSFLYALTALADWLNAPELLDSASALAGIITPELIHADHLLDVMKGSAGTLLALLHFAQVARTRGIMADFAVDRAMICGNHLLDSRVANDSKPRAWVSSQGHPLAGFVHGAGGISYALARLYEQTKEEEFRDAAFEGFAFERTLYVPEQQGWRDPHSNQIMEPGSWCHGAPGIALARLSCVRSMDEPAVRHDLEEALSIARSLPEASDDQLCCGNFGRIDVLHTAGSVLGRLQLSDFARESSRRIVERSESDNFRFRTPFHENLDEPSHTLKSSLFLGLAGVGYTLLRLSYPELLPSVLLLEAQT